MAGLDSLTVFDWVVLVVVVSSALIGLLRGFVREVFSLAGFVVAFVIANTWASDMASWLPGMVVGTTVRLMVGFSALFFGSLLVCALVGRALSEVVRALGLTAFDRSLGAAFGAARGVVIVFTLAVLAGLTSMPSQPFWRNAELSGAVETGVRAVKPWLPVPWAEHVHF